MEQFLTGDIWGAVNKLLSRKQKNTACIAYVTSDNLHLSKGDILICDASTSAIKFGKTNAKILDTYLERGVIIFSNEDLHTKLLITENFLVIGSANLSNNSLSLLESSVVTNNDILISQAKAFCHLVAKESDLLSRKKIDSLLRIEVIKQSFKSKTKSKIGSVKFGNRYWFVTASILKERAYNKVKDKVEETTSSISKKENISEDDINFLRWEATSEFGKNAKEGDQIIIRLNNESKTRSNVFPPCTILQREIINGHVYLFHDDRNTEENKLPWSKFQELLKKTDKEIDIGKRRVKLISEEDARKIMPFWKKHGNP